VIPYETDAHVAEVDEQSWQRELPGRAWRRCRHAGGKDRSASSGLSPPPELEEEELLSPPLLLTEGPCVPVLGREPMEPRSSRLQEGGEGEEGRRIASSSAAANCNNSSRVSTLLVVLVSWAR